MPDYQRHFGLTQVLRYPSFLHRPALAFAQWFSRVGAWCERACLGDDPVEHRLPLREAQAHAERLQAQLEADRIAQQIAREALSQQLADMRMLAHALWIHDTGRAAFPDRRWLAAEYTRAWRRAPGLVLPQNERVALGEKLAVFNGAFRAFPVE